MYRDTMNVEPEMYDCSSNNWSHWNSNEKLKEKFGNCTRKTFDRFTTKDSFTWNITHNTESTAVWSLKTKWWGSPLVQEKYQEEKPVTRDIHIIIIVVIIIIIIHGTSHIIRKVLQCEAWSVSGGDHRWFKRSTRKKRSVTVTTISYDDDDNDNNYYIITIIIILS